jgi:hypothetical protein
LALLELPAEIRLKILRELLWQPEPLKFLGKAFSKRRYAPPLTDREIWRDLATATNYSFYPAILAVCHKLNEEGSPLLYEENTVAVVAYSRGGYCEWLGHPTWLKYISESLSARTRKLRITIKVSSPGYSRTMRREMQRFVTFLQANPQWCSLDVRLEGHVAKHLREQSLSDKKDDLSPYETVLRPFNLLRRLRHMEVTGVSPQFAAELSNLAKSDCAVIDLPKMHWQLRNYLSLYFKEEVRDIPREEYWLADDAVDAGNATDFYWRASRRAGPPGGMPFADSLSLTKLKLRPSDINKLHFDPHA